MTLRFALVGSSGFAAQLAAPALAQAPVELAGVLGSTPERSARLAEQGYGRAYRSLDELLDDDGVDAVWVTTHDLLHAPIGLACLDAGKHLLLEKPLATNVDDAAALVAAAERQGLVLRVGCHQRFRPAYGDLRALVAGGSLGTLGFARIHYYRPLQAVDREPNWWRRSLRDSGGSWVTKGLGSHLLDLLLWITGSETAAVATAVLAQYRWEVETEDTATVVLRLDGGATAVATMSFGLVGGPSLIELCGTEASVRGDDLWYGHGRIESSSGETQEYACERLDPYVAQLADFASAVAGGPSRGADGRDGLAVTRLVAAALSHADETRRVPA